MTSGSDLGGHARASGVSPTVASTFAGIAGILWSQAIIRYVAENMSLEFWNLVLPEKAVDVLAIWLDSIIAGLLVFTVTYFVFRRRKSVGSMKAWLALLLVSAFIRYL